MKNSTKDRFFLDTNLIVYLFDKKSDHKQQIARNLLKKALENREGIISFQVIQEFCNVALRKFEVPMSPEDLKNFINRYLQPICDINPSFEIYNRAIEIHKIFKYSFYDSLIIAAAQTGNCKILYSEDLQHDQQIHGISIVNPFL